MSSLFLTRVTRDRADTAQQLQAGASGCMFGLLSIYAVDYFLNWRYYQRPKRKVFFWVGASALSFLFGIFPGVDNAAHFGGSLTGIFAAMIVLPQTFELSARKSRKVPTLTRLTSFQWFRMRVIGGALLITFFVSGLLVFYLRSPTAVCNWCEQSSCIKIWNWCK